MGDKVRGNLIIIGGAEDKKNKCTILKKVAEIAGGEKANLVVLTTATQLPQEVGQQYREVFAMLGVKDITVLNINSREDANQLNNVQVINHATAIFFTGGDQLRISSILGGSLVNQALHDAYQRGVLIVGTSAGASVMSSTMIVEGMDNEAARKCTLKMAPGLGLLEEAIIDQHFDQRGRIGRLLCGIAQNPYMLGIGIDEDTAIRVFPEDYFEVIGSNAVTIVDGRTIKSTNVSEANPDELLALSNVTLHVIPQGYEFDMKNRIVSQCDRK
ncbi:cyanophycinase [Petroclostridium sp. X23]|uniref:cyanophycinase n=1 Tax=Petroclostridium sp. X23 TaxID=3045146 RepID=UPI0024AD5A63|nr:cyanophycinase [Petroclostridium sp. X23]WHH57383.1 cyanophycinase [Petroclostridium sp. X23]